MATYQVKREWQRESLSAAIQAKIQEGYHIAQQQGGNLSLNKLGAHIAEMFEEVVVSSPKAPRTGKSA